MGTVQLKPFSSNQIEKTQKKGTVQLNLKISHSSPFTIVKSGCLGEFQLDRSLIII
jgi:hypothetical protein